MEQISKHKGTRQTVFWIAVITSWLTLPLFVFMPFGLLFWIGALLYLFLEKSKFKWYLLLFSSWTLVSLWSFASGTKDYFQGKAAIESFGLPDAEFYNLDPDLRVWNSTSGCIVMGSELFTQAPNNLAVRFWTSLLGTQKGVYTGTYPTKDEAKELMNKSESVTLTKQADAFLLNYRNQTLILRSDNYKDVDLLERTTKGKVIVFNNECLLVETKADTTRPVILLADRSNGKIFARYYNNQTP
jgi:hypothetical protein